MDPTVALTDSFVASHTCAAISSISVTDTPASTQMKRWVRSNFTASPGRKNLAVVHSALSALLVKSAVV